MSNRRHLVSRARQDNSSTPAPSSSRRAQEGTAPSIALPPYEPPTCPLTLNAKRKIDELRDTRDVRKYENHIKAAIKTVGFSTANINDRLQERNREAANAAKKREKQGEMTEEMKKKTKEDEKYCERLKSQVAKLTKESDEVVRKLIDLMDENKMQDTILRGVEAGIPDAPVARQNRRPGEGEDAAEEEEETAMDVDIMSAVELMKTKQEEYKAKYQGRSNFERYADANDYKHFKKMVHDAQYPDEDAPPLPRANTWFPEDTIRRRNNTADNTRNQHDEESDEEIQIQSATTKLKCSLTLQYFEEPFSTDKCPHVFEKSAITDYYNANSTDFRDARGVPTGVRKFKCPETGCNQMLTITDFHDDALMQRKVKRALKEAARQEREEDEEDDDTGPRGTGRNRPERIESEDEDDVMDIDNVRRRAVAKTEKFKKEQSAAPSQRMAQSEESEDDEIVDMA